MILMSLVSNFSDGYSPRLVASFGVEDTQRCLLLLLGKISLTKADHITCYIYIQKMLYKQITD